jgi:hypothetical protein
MNWHSELVAQRCLYTPQDSPLDIDDGPRLKSTFFQKNCEKLGSSVPQNAVAGLFRVLLAKIQALRLLLDTGILHRATSGSPVSWIMILGYFDLNTRMQEPIDNPFGPRLLPM